MNTKTQHYQAFDVAIERACESIAVGDHDSVRMYLASAHIQNEKIRELTAEVARDHEGMCHE